MNINLRALLFGTAVTAALTIAMNVVAAEKPGVNRTRAVAAMAHRDAPGADGNVEVIRLDPVVVTAHKNAAL